jgi:hypothetical protein
MHKCHAFILILLHMVVYHFSSFGSLEDLCDVLVMSPSSDTPEQRLRSDLLALFFWYFTESEAVPALLSLLQDGVVTSVDYDALHLPWKPINVDTIFPDCPNFKAVNLLREQLMKDVSQQDSATDYLWSTIAADGSVDRKVVALRWRPHEWYVLHFLGVQALQKYISFKLDSHCRHQNADAIWKFLFLHSITGTHSEHHFPWNRNERKTGCNDETCTAQSKAWVYMIQRMVVSCMREMVASDIALPRLSVCLQDLEAQHKIPYHLLLDVMSQLCSTSKATPLDPSRFTHKETAQHKHMTPKRPPLLGKLHLQTRSLQDPEYLHSQTARRSGSGRKIRIANSTPPGSPTTGSRKLFSHRPIPPKCDSPKKRRASFCDIELRPKAHPCRSESPAFGGLALQLEMWSAKEFPHAGRNESIRNFIETL